MSLTGLAAIGAATPASAADQRSAQLPGPVIARVLRVVDGDTINVRATIWIGQQIEVSVRLAGIDAPELRSRCAGLRNRAWRARNRLHDLIAGSKVILRAVRRGTYAGRVIAEVETTDGKRLGPLLMAAGLAEPYRRGRKSKRARTACPASDHAALASGH